MIPASELTEYVRMLEVAGKATGTPLVFWSSSLTPRQDGLRVDADHPWARRYPLASGDERPAGLVTRSLGLQADALYNSWYPRTGNDGALWVGKGASGIVQGGVELRWGRVTARLYPAYVYATNLTFDLGSGPGTAKSPFAYPWHAGIDYPQRFGNSPVSFVDPGQSEVRADFGAFTAGFSTENMWWGPAHRNAIIMGAAAPGFPHVDLGTGRPLHTTFGDVEFRQIWGELAASSYSGPYPDGGRRFITGVALGFRPAALTGLTFGVTRMIYHDVRFGEWSLRDALLPYGRLVNNARFVQPDGTTGNDQDDQLASVMLRWLFPGVGFEAYLEYARNDFGLDAKALVVDPGHSRAYTAGFRKVIAAPDATWSLTVETTNLTLPTTDLQNGEAQDTYYVHGINREGYTNRGQLLGATIGPGSSSQYVGLDRYTAGGRAGVYLQRVRQDDDYLLQVTNDPFTYLRGQVDVSIGASLTRFGSRTDWGAAVEASKQYSHNFVYSSNPVNLRLSLHLGWR
jgi:hypothetical protein